MCDRDSMEGARSSVVLDEINQPTAMHAKVGTIADRTYEVRRPRSQPKIRLNLQTCCKTLRLKSEHHNYFGRIRYTARAPFATTTTVAAINQTRSSPMRTSRLRRAGNI